MAVWDRCRPCSGVGTFKCNDCKCPRCEASGTVRETCPKCSGSKKAACDQCQGAGQLLKKRWFSDTYEACRRCSGSGRLDCACHSGTVSVPCPACNGATREAQCSKCGSTGQSRCPACGGSGQVRSEWYRSLATMTSAQLQYEYDSRDQRKSTVATEISELTRAVNELLRSDPYNYDYDNMLRERERYYSEEKELRAEKDAIIDAMSSKVGRGPLGPFFRL